MAETPLSKRRHGLLKLTALLTVLTVGAGSAVTLFSYLHRNVNPGCESPRSSSACIRVFFIGNSYTSFNDLPTTFANLAWSGGHRVETALHAPGGWALVNQKLAPDTEKTLTASRWDLVVLQEQSEISSVESLRQADMYPAAHDLVAMTRAAGAQPMFFLTWGHRNGWPANGMPDYASMQSSVDAGYLFIAGQEHAAVAPVGDAWMAIVDQNSDPGLWQDDGSHPTAKGTYVAACVFYASIFHQSPVGLSYHDFLSDSDAAQSQAAAASTVLSDPSKWGLPG